jgi:hypothetical protein
MNPATAIPARVVALSSALSQPKPMRRGTLNERRMKCGQPHCPCQQDPQARHGPYFTLTQAWRGKTRTRYVSAEQLSTLRHQIEAGRQFRQQVETYWEACEHWADVELSQASEPSAQGAEKKGSRRASKPRSPTRSKR